MLLRSDGQGEAQVAFAGIKVLIDIACYKKKRYEGGNKHQGKENYDYRNTKEPLHLIRELEIIDELLEKAKQRLRMSPNHRVFLVADHGATRMAVIMENLVAEARETLKKAAEIKL